MEIINKNINDNMLKEAYIISKTMLGTGYSSLKRFKNAYLNNNLLLAIDNNECLGFLIYNLLDEKTFLKSRNINAGNKDTKILNFYSCAVKTPKKHIGTNLFKKCIELYENKVDKFYCQAWKSKNGINVEPLLLSLNFIKQYEIKNYWYNESLNKKDYCPLCGSPCTCSLVIYSKDIKK